MMNRKRINTIFPVILLLLVFIFPLASKSISHHHDLKHYHLYTPGHTSLYHYEKPCPICNYEFVTFMPCPKTGLDFIKDSRAEKVYALIPRIYCLLPIYISLRGPPASA